MVVLIENIELLMSIQMTHLVAPSNRNFKLCFNDSGNRSDYLYLSFLYLQSEVLSFFTYKLGSKLIEYVYM